MLKQVFSKFFRTSETERFANNSNKNIVDKPPIYAIPTISSCFQQSSNPAPSLSSYYNNTLDSNNNTTNSTSQKSVSSISPSTSSSNSSSSIGVNNTSTRINKTSTSNKSKYNDLSTRQIYIAPHCIRYTNSTLDDTIYRIDDESLNEIAAEILESDNLPPKLQIVFYDGKYFAINNSHLQIYKQLQLSGLITHVQADVISVEAIPYALRQHLLQTPANTANSNEDTDEDYTEEVFDCSRNEPCTSDGLIISDVISPNSIEMLTKEMLVDETYEFGACENCIESDNEEERKESVDDNVTKEEIDYSQDYDNYNVVDDEDEEDNDEERCEDYEDDEVGEEDEQNQIDYNKMVARRILEEELKAQHLNWKLNQTSNELSMDLSGIKNKIIKNSKKSGDNLVVKDEDILKYLNEVNETNEYKKFVSSYDEDSSEIKNGLASTNRRKASDKKLKTSTHSSKLKVDDSTQELKTLLSNENDIAEFKD